MLNLESIAEAGGANESDLVQKAQDQLGTLALDEAARAGFMRDRRTYFLNIAYPSMQAMEPVSEADIFPADNATSQEKERKVALYLHVPFCSAECYYCHYYKEFKKPEDTVDAFIEGVQAELTTHEQNLGDITARSVYVGGGTPSYLKPEQIDRLFRAIKDHVEIEPDAEVSFEMHPESSDEERMRVLQEHGVNRINIGVESFDDNLLASENRRHTRQEAIDALARANAMGFSNVNIDFIYGLKDHTIPIWENTLDTISELRPSSATLYYLRLKRGTPEYKLFQAHPERFPSEEELLLMHAMTFERLEGELNYTQNPVDWFIRDPKYFHTYQDHNWRRSDDTELLGVGPSAYSYMNGWQYYNVNHTGRYIESVMQGHIPVWRGERLEGDERMRRTIMLGIKMGIHRDSFRQTYGIDVVDAFPQEWESLSALDMIEVHEDAVVLTYLGKLLADETGKAFYSETMRKRMEQVDPSLVSTTWPQFNR